MTAHAIEIVEPSGGLADVPERANIITPWQMLATAVDRGADIATIERLSALAERMEAQQARRAFDEAISAFKAEAPAIVKSRTIMHGAKLIAKYEDLSAIAKAIDPVLARNGLSYRFRTGTMDKTVKVTCIISHRAGHCEETSLTGPHDASGAKNAIQGVGSSVTYLQRYTLKAALGLAASEDDDGASHGAGDTVTDQQAEEIETLIFDTGGELSAFLQFKRLASLNEIKAKDFEAICNEIKRIAAKRAERANV